MSEAGYVALGTRLKDRYELLREIGRGGFSVVYEAMDHVAGKSVAVKLLVPPPAIAKIARERIQREVKAVRSLASPYLVPVYDLLEEGPWTFIVMEFISGCDLQELISTKGPLTVEAVVRLGTEVGEVLNAAHRKGILHRDVKPQNILVGEDGWARLTDFGSAKIEGQNTLTHTGAFVGTLDYTAPEVMNGGRPDARSDIYSLGLTLYFALTARLPQRSASQMTLPLSTDGYHPLEWSPQIPVWMDELIAQATRSDSQSRFPTVTSMLDALRQRSTLSAQSGMERMTRCIVCGNRDPFGLWICPACAARASHADTFITIEPVSQRQERKRVFATLQQFLKTPPSRSGLKEVVAGRKPLIKIGSLFAQQALDRLTALPVPARIIPANQVWKLIPRDFYLLVVLVIGVGFAAGKMSNIDFLWITPLVAGFLFLSGWFLVQNPLLKSTARKSRLPESLQSRVFDVLSQLTSQSAIALYSDLAAFVEEIFPESDSQPDLKRNLSDLLRSFSSAAVKLNEIENTLNRMEPQRGRFRKMPEGWIDAFHQCEQARDMLVQRFLEAIAMVGQIRSQLILGSQGQAELLEDLITELEAELQIHVTVAKEMQSLILADSNLPAI